MYNVLSNLVITMRTVCIARVLMAYATYTRTRRILYDNHTLKLLHSLPHSDHHEEFG